MLSIKKHTKIFTVFSFLRIKSPDLIWYQWIYPTVLCIFISLFIYYLGDNFFQINNNKLIGDLNVLMGVLFGFYIAALAAVSSFLNPNLDKEMEGRTPTLKRFINGNTIIEKLTRKRFLIMLLGCCAGLSITLYIFGIIKVNLILILPKEKYLQKILSYSELIFSILYLWMLSSLLIITLLGLYYLIERIHRKN